MLNAFEKRCSSVKLIEFSLPGEMQSHRFLNADGFLDLLFDLTYDLHLRLIQVKAVTLIYGRGMHNRCSSNLLY